MTATTIDGKALANQRREQLRTRVQTLQATGCHPCLAAVTVVPDAGWKVYQRGQAKACEAVGISYRAEVLPDGADQQDLIECIEKLNADPDVHGVIIQAPLKDPFDLFQAQSLLSPAKDVEGVNPANLGLVMAGRSGIAPCTARSAVALAEHHLGDLKGLEATVIGSSVIVGKPVSQLLVNAGATPRLCHIDTKDVASHCRDSDLVVVAVGRPGLLTADMVKPGATVIDVGINRVPGPDGKSRIVGDVAEDVWQVAGAVTPVPGGVGSLTTVILLEHTVSAAERLGSERPAIGGAALARILGPVASDLSPEVADRLAGLLSRHLVTGAMAEVRSVLERRLERGVVIMDGAMGTELIARGIPIDEVRDSNRNHPDLVQQVHRDYLQAGAEVLLTNTFTLNRYTVPDRSELAAQISAGVRLARQVAGGEALVLGSIGPLPGIVGADLPDEEAEDAFAEVALAMADAGVDGFIGETLPSTRHAEAALAGIRRASSLPVIISRCYGRDRASELRTFAERMDAGGATAIGINCVGGPSALLPVVRQLAVVSRLPVMARPNAGYPRLDEGKAVYHLRPEWMARQAKAYVNAGVRLIGGCCGVGPGHIKAAAQVARDRMPATVELPPAPGPDIQVAGNQVPALDSFEVMALLPGSLDSQQAIEASESLTAAGVTAVGIDIAWPGSPSVATLPSHIRHLQDRSGGRGVLCLTADVVDLRAAEQACEAAHLLGLDRVLIDAGIFCPGFTGQGASAKQLVTMISNRNAGLNAAGNVISDPSSFLIGVRLPVDAMNQGAELAEAGAHFATVQPVYDPAKFRDAMQRYQTEMPLLAEVLVLPDADTAEALDNEVPALSVPASLIDRLSQDPEEDVRGVLNFLGHWRDRLAGVCLVLPDERTNAATAVVAGLKVTT